MKIVLMGMPGVGKGTQAVRLRDQFGLLHLSTGDILREAVKAESELGRQAQEFMVQGQLVPDQLIGDLISERLTQPDARGGYILDGFPRTVEQISILDRALESIGESLDQVVLLGAPEEEIVRRLSGRRVCESCGAVYHVESSPPAVEGRCDQTEGCQGAVIQRPDDTEGVIRERLRVYREKTLPIADAYEKRGLLARIDGTGTPEDVFGRLQGMLNVA